jgi:hypothetical protein
VRARQTVLFVQGHHDVDDDGTLVNLDGDHVSCQAATHVIRSALEPDDATGRDLPLDT